MISKVSVRSFFLGISIAGALITCIVLREVTQTTTKISPSNATVPSKNLMTSFVERLRENNVLEILLVILIVEIIYASFVSVCEKYKYSTSGSYDVTTTRNEFLV